MKTIAALIGAAAAIATPAAALAADFGITEEITFAYDFDAEMLDTQAGAVAVYNDLVSEARKACTLSGVRGYMQVDQACVDELVAKVVASLDSPTLEAAYKGSEGVEEVTIAPLTVAER